MQYCLCSLETCVAGLENEVRLDYDRTMNRLIFDKVVMSCPEDLSHITLPQKDPEYVPSQGKIFCIMHLLVTQVIIKEM